MRSSFKCMNEPEPEREGPKRPFVQGIATGLDALRRRAMRSVIAGATAIFVLSSIGCHGTSKIPKIGDLQGALGPGDFAKLSSGALVPGDVLKLSFPGAPDLSQAQKIRADGKVSLPLIGEVSA